MEYFRLRPEEMSPDVVAPEASNRVGDLVFLLLHDMAQAQSLALGELPVRRRMEELAVRVDDCDTLGGNLAVIAGQGPQTAEDREILCFYFALGLKGRLTQATGTKRQKVLLKLRETLDFLSGVFGPRILGSVQVLESGERQMLWDLVGGTLLALGREQHVPGVREGGAVMRWASLMSLAPGTDRRVVARALLQAGPPPAGRLAVIGILDPLADAELLAQIFGGRGAGLAAANTRSTTGDLAFLEGPEIDLSHLADPGESAELPPEGLDAEPDTAETAAVEALAAEAVSGIGPEASGESVPEGANPASTSEPAYEVAGSAVPMRSPGRRLLANLTGWALAERLGALLARVFLGLHREGHLRLTRTGLIYDESLFLLGRAVRERTVAIPMESIAARLDRRHNLGTLFVGLGAAIVAAFLGTLWTLDGFRTGYWPLFLLGGGALCAGLVVDLLIFRITGRLRGKSQLVLDGGEGARLRLDGVRRAEAEALLTALAGPSRFAKR